MNYWKIFGENKEFIGNSFIIVSIQVDIDNNVIFYNLPKYGIRVELRRTILKGAAKRRRKKYDN